MRKSIGVEFVPFTLKTYGTIHHKFLQIVKILAKYYDLLKGIAKSLAVASVREVLTIAAMRQLVQQIMAWGTPMPDLSRLAYSAGGGFAPS